MTSKTDGSSVAGRMWTTTLQMWHLKAGCSTYVRQQPVRHGWRQLTVWLVALQDGITHCLTDSQYWFYFRRWTVWKTSSTCCHQTVRKSSESTWKRSTRIRKLMSSLHVHVHHSGTSTARFVSLVSSWEKLYRVHGSILRCKGKRSHAALECRVGAHLPLWAIETTKAALTPVPVLVPGWVICTSEVRSSGAFTVTCTSTNTCNSVTVKNLVKIVK